jgi:glutamine synthetase
MKDEAINKGIVAKVEALDIRLIRYLYCDLAGVIRGKTVHASQFPKKISEGVGLTRAQNAVNLFEELVPVEGMEPVGEVRIIPDPETFTILPWVDRTAGMFSDLLEQDGSEWGGCTRSVLKRAIDFAAKNLLPFCMGLLAIDRRVVLFGFRGLEDHCVIVLQEHVASAKGLHLFGSRVFALRA